MSREEELKCAISDISAECRELRKQNLAQAAQIELLKDAITEVFDAGFVPGNSVQKALSMPPSQALEQFAAKAQAEAFEAAANKFEEVFDLGYRTPSYYLAAFREMAKEMK